jgi:N-acyl-phosphatidylethanolamine-hydrolysing phospholipase D
MFDFFRWQFSGGRNVPDFRSAVGRFPVVEPDWDQITHPGEELVVTWIGHATVLVQMDGITLLTDPVFSRRCSPLPFAGPERYTPIPFPVDRLPKIDGVVISHNHYDHLDAATVRALGNHPTWFIPLGLEDWFRRRGITNIVVLDWWEEADLGSVRVVCTPAQHFSGRGPFDRNRTLWCSWALIGPRNRFWFAGDTGYSPVFQEIGKRYGPFDLAALPLGAYCPEWFMLPMHLHPRQAVQVRADVQARRAVGIHWGTFILSDEPVDEPVRLLEEARRQSSLDEDQFFVLRHGETRSIPSASDDR